MSRRAFPALCQGQDGLFESREAAEEHYRARGFGMFDAVGDWALMRNGVFEAYIRRDGEGWQASVIQLEPVAA